MLDQKNILVIGSTGQQGGAAARELLTNGFSVKAMTRKPESENAKALAKLGAETIKGDMDDVLSFQQAMQRVWGVFSVQNTW